MLLEVKNDTLVQTWPVNENGQIDENNYRIEKFIGQNSHKTRLF